MDVECCSDISPCSTVEPCCYDMLVDAVCEVVCTSVGNDVDSFVSGPHAAGLGEDVAFFAFFAIFAAVIPGDEWVVDVSVSVY